MPNQKVTLSGKDEGGTSTVTLDTSKNTWTATNDSAPDLLKTLKGTFITGRDLYPGFKTLGTALTMDGKSPIDKDSMEAFLYNYDPAGSVKTGSAEMFQTASLGNWTRG